MNTNWTATLEKLNQRGQASVLVTVFATKGSTPRATGSKMLVCDSNSYYSIGGGHLEHQAIQLARQMLAAHDSQPLIKSFSLGASLGQCCGGHVELLFEAFYPPSQTVAVFGAGHIAKALLPILQQLPCRTQWLDSRAELFPTDIPSNCQKIVSTELVACVEQLPTDSYILIMTHNHQLDQQLCEAILQRQQYSFIGLIGSDTKWKKFKLRLARKGFSQQQINDICCPIGVPGIKGKLPMEIAVSVSAQFINFYNRQQHSSPTVENHLSQSQHLGNISSIS